MSEQAKFQIGDRVLRGDEDKVGTVVDVIIMNHANGQEHYVYRAEFGGSTLLYVPCDLQLFTEKEETNDETNDGENQGSR